MKIRKIRNIAGLMAAAAITMIGTSANGAFQWYKISSNNAEDVSSQLSMEVGGSGASLVLTFRNNVGIASSITDIYIDAPPQGSAQIPNPYFTSIGVLSSAGVSFSAHATPSNLPEGNPHNFVAVTQSADSDGPVSANGVNAALEWVRLTLNLTSPTQVDDVIAALASGDFRVGLHVQAIGTAGGSDSYMTGPVVPEPATIVAGALLLLPFGASAIRILRRNRAA